MVAPEQMEGHHGDGGRLAKPSLTHLKVVSRVASFLDYLLEAGRDMIPACGFGRQRPSLILPHTLCAKASSGAFRVV